MRRRLPKYVIEDVDRHGKIRVYFRRAGQRKVLLTGIPWTTEFMDQYAAAMKGSGPVDPPGRRIATSLPNTWRWLVEGYFQSADYRRLDPTTRAARRRTLEATCQEPIYKGAQLLMSEMPLAKFGKAAVVALRDRKLETPTAANATVKAIRAVFAWAIETETAGIKVNPGEQVKYFKVSTEGHHTWTIDEVRQYEARHPIGTNARLALALLLYTGVRRSDVIRLGRQLINQGWLKFTTHKGREKHPIVVEIPILPALANVIDQTQTGHLTFLITHHGKPYTAGGFSTRMRDWCNEAGLPHCSAHGLRKAGATIAADNGATTKQLI